MVPIGCAGVAVYPGDVFVGDRDGVVVVPRALAEVVAAPAEEQESRERWIHERVLEGASLCGTYLPDAQTLTNYESWRNGQGSA